MNAMQRLLKAESEYKPDTENIFEILRARDNEGAHSNMLAWLLDAFGSHGLGGACIKGLLSAVEQNEGANLVKKIEKKDRAFKSFTVQREVSFSKKDDGGRMDILLVSEKANFVICIENKVFSSEHSKQLVRYADYLQKKYSSKDNPFDFLFIYLTPGGELPSDDRWTSLSYKDLHSIIEASAFPKKNAGIADGKLKSFVEDYLASARYIGEFGSRSGKSFDAFIKGMEGRVTKDFSTLKTSLAPGRFNAHFTDTALTRFAPADEPGGYAKVRDLFFIDIKFEAEQREKGVLACVLAFTNHPKNLAKESEFRKAFNPNSLKFRWQEVKKIEEPLLKKDETVDDFFLADDGEKRMYKVVKKLLSEMDEYLVENKLKTKKIKAN